MMHAGSSACRSTANDLGDAVAALGPVFNHEVLAATREIYRAHIPHAGSGGVECIEDIAWGAAPKQTLDLYLPPDACEAPVVLFVHGGGFVAGDKAEDETFCRNVGEFFAHHGFVTAIPNYRLAPLDPWPAGAQDVGNVIAWIEASIVQHGGDPSAIVAVAQSAGANHIATWLFDEDVRGGRAQTLRGVALLSGFYRADSLMSPGARSYFGSDETTYVRRSVAARVHDRHPPLLLTTAELDPGSIAAQTFDFAAQLALVDGRSPRLIWLEGHNHVSPVLSLGSPHDHVGQLLVAFARSSLRD